MITAMGPTLNGRRRPGSAVLLVAAVMGVARLLHRTSVILVNCAISRRCRAQHAGAHGRGHRESVLPADRRRWVAVAAFRPQRAPPAAADDLPGLGWGLSIGLVDGEALAAVPAHLAGTAAGLLNLFRVGSEAIAVAAYSAVLAGLIRHSLADPAVAARISAGHPGQPDAYAGALHIVLVAIVSLVAVVTVAVWLLHRSSTRRSSSARADRAQTMAVAAAATTNASTT
jgi:hypothetical protein